MGNVKRRSLQISFVLFHVKPSGYNINDSCFRLPSPLPRIMRSRTFSAAARDRRPIFWQRKSKGRSASEARLSSPTIDRRIRSPTFTARSDPIRMIPRRIITSWRWLTSPDAAFSRETWVIDRELRGTDSYELWGVHDDAFSLRLTADVAQMNGTVDS